MIIPYSTDAPLYHMPFVTIGLIISNIVIYCVTMLQVSLGNLDLEQVQWLTFEFNQINPLQWLTGNFMHADIFHLLGNMFFLFCFGLVVEGKTGNGRFLAIYLGMCVAVGAVAQVPMFLMGGEGYALGASGVIFGLMVIAVIWAPENELECIQFFLLVPSAFEARIMTFGGFFIGLQVIFLVFNGFSMSGAMGHMIGVLTGLPVAIVMLRNGTVDCEGWDIVSRNEWLQQYSLLYSDEQRKKDEQEAGDVANPVATALALEGGDVSRSNTLGLTTAINPSGSNDAPAPSDSSQSTPAVKKKKTRRKKKSAKKKSAVDSGAAAVQQCQAHPEFNRLTYVLRQSLQSQNLPAAQQAFLRMDQLKIAAGVQDQSLMQYALALGQQQQWVNAIRPLAIIANKQGPMADDACLRLAQVQLRVLQRPDQAIATLEKITTPEGVRVDAAKRERLKKRDQLLQTARGI